ncbi:MAG: hypothetical protein IJU93_06290 [Lachnospiraceae bacterium]|nr:hypothetical protein [Lachnospiraceae bacterium]
MIRKALVRKISLFGLTALMVGAMLIGCGSGADDKALTTNEASADAEEATAAVEAQTEEEEQSKDNAKTTGPVSTDGSNPFDIATATDEERNLTGDELKAIEEAFNSSKYNGFLSAEFKSPKDIWWDEVFYNGAELESEYDDDTVSDAYLKETGDEELFGSLTYFSSGDMEKIHRVCHRYVRKEDEASDRVDVS